MNSCFNSLTFYELDPFNLLFLCTTHTTSPSTLTLPDLTTFFRLSMSEDKTLYPSYDLIHPDLLDPGLQRKNDRWTPG